MGPWLFAIPRESYYRIWIILGWFLNDLQKRLNQTGSRYEILNGGLPDTTPYFQLHFYKNTFAGP